METENVDPILDMKSIKALDEDGMQHLSQVCQPLSTASTGPVSPEYDWKPCLTAKDIASAETLSIFMTRPPQGINKLPRVDGLLKSYLLNYFQLPQDFHLRPCVAIVNICKRISEKTGKEIIPNLVSKLLASVRRKQAQYKNLNENLFKGLDWDFKTVEALPLYDTDQIL